METLELDLESLADLLLDLWRIDRRAHRQATTPETVRIACELAMDRVRLLGFELREPTGEPYDDQMRLRVVDYEPAEGDLRISECLAPAVYYRAELVRPAEVVIRGKRDNGAANG